MKYLCLIYLEEKTIDSLPRSEWNDLIQDCENFTEIQQEAGHYLAGDALEPTHTATSVRLRNGKISITDGPFAETKEQLAGYCLLEARDLNEAIQLASQLPPLRYGCVEVRPVRELEHDLPAFNPG
jgi:hypothetical protein